MRTEQGRHAHPSWLIEATRDAWPDRWRRVLEANNERAPMALRVNARRLGRDEYLARLAERGLRAEALEGLSHGVVLATPCDVMELPGFEEGLVSVQDAAAQLAAPLLAPVPGARVLDACAAPGGKSAHLLELEPRCAELVALDVEAERVERMRENLARLGLAASTRVADASEPQRWWDGQPFERILLDAPCSATGVIRRHPDVKVLRRPSDVETMRATQARLLAALWPLLADQGALLYATCSYLPRENDEVIAEFVASRPEVAVHPIRLAEGRSTSHGWQILPGEGGMDGFYYALLGKP
jgi:16S rRNA (cytosine967-C5)-methyltransferase